MQFYRNSGLAFLLILISFSVFGQTFPCDNGQRLYFFQETGAQYGSLSYITNYTTATPSVTVMFPMSTQQHNGLGANPIDHYLYYKDWNVLKRITSAGSVTTVCTLAGQSLYGCFDHLGRYWTIQTGQLVAYNISSCTVVKGPYPLNIVNGFLDVVFNPKDCHLYIGDMKVDTNGVVDPGYPGTVFLPSGTYGGAAVGSDGNIYGTGGSTTTGDLSVIDLTTNSSHLVSSFAPGPVFSKSDMASFPCFNVQALFSDSLTSCNSLTVFFTDSSSGPVGNWSWNFGDPASGGANTSALQDPSHTFSAAGTYTVTLIVSTGNNLCYASSSDTATMVVTISASSGFSVIPAQSNILCNGSCTGSASVTVSSGTSPYSYSWNSGQTTNTISSLCSGTYTVLITDAGGCSATQTISIAQPAALSATTTATQASCGSSVGSATVTVTGGTSGYTYAWSPTGGTNNIATGLGIGNYTCVLTDANGCMKVATVSITNSGAPFVSLAGQANVLCSGGNSGSASVTASGGTPGYTYSWSPSGGTTSAATGLSAGNYFVTVTDGAGCSNIQAVTITEPAVLSYSISSSPSGCAAGTGAASVVPSGGTSPYTYSWSPIGGTNAAATGLVAGNYSVIVQDANGCTQTATVSVASTGNPSVTIANQANILCNGINNGSAGVAPSGGTSPYTYAWSPSGGTNASAFGLSAGTYSVLVTDASGCTALQMISITQPPIITAVPSSLPSACNASSGSASVLASGGTGAFSYFWDPVSQTSSAISGLSSGSYTVTVSDANGCTQTATVMVSSVGGPTITVSSDLTITAGDSATLTASGTGNYLWNTGETTSSVTVAPSATTTYTVVITDASGCTGLDSVTVFVELPDPCTGINVPAFFIPSAFSPNKDMENDVLCLQGITDCIDEFTIRIYNRWGEEVFVSADKTFCWDGTYKNDLLNTAVFVYYLEAVLKNADQLKKKGNVSLIR